jgi:hypothetical protein
VLLIKTGIREEEGWVGNGKTMDLALGQRVGDDCEAWNCTNQ